MGFIYKATNVVNGNIYIGQTRVSVQGRWREHCRQSRGGEEQDFAFHRAIAKYGENNFTIETIEEVPDDILNEREIFWIAHYNSYNNGYNCALGGLGHTKYNYDDIVNYYLSHGFSILQTCEHFNIYDQVVYNALKSKNIDYKTLNQQVTKKARNFEKKQILLVEKNLIFNSMKEIDEYFGKQVHPNIRRCLNGITKKAYGYTWKEIEGSELVEENLCNK